jgi:uncharacterized protein (TIGR02246 family)
MRTRSLVLLTVVPFLATACSRPDDAAATAESAAGVAAATAATDAGAVRQAVEAANARFVDAAKRGDTATLASMYTDDAVLMMSNSEAARGRNAIAKWHGGMLSQMPMKEFSLRTDDVVLGGDLAVETGRYEMTLQPRGGSEVKDKGKYVVVWKRQADGSWKILRDIANSDLPAKT